MCHDRFAQVHAHRVTSLYSTLIYDRCPRSRATTFVESREAEQRSYLRSSDVTAKALPSLPPQDSVKVMAHRRATCPKH